MLVSSQELEQMAAQSYNKLKSEAAANGTLNTDGAMQQRVRAIAARLEPQTAVFRPDAPGWKWEVNVINSNELNAFCMPGGKIMFYSGLIRQLASERRRDRSRAWVMRLRTRCASTRASRCRRQWLRRPQSASVPRCSAWARARPILRASVTRP